VGHGTFFAVDQGYRRSPSIPSLKSPCVTSYVAVTSKSTRENKRVRVYGHHDLQSDLCVRLT